jgi:hypothetical protein
LALDNQACTDLLGSRRVVRLREHHAADVSAAGERLVLKASVARNREAGMDLVVLLYRRAPSEVFTTDAVFTLQSA